MNVFLTGATGFIGSAVAEALEAAGHRVSGLARADAAARRLASAGVEARRGDLHDAAALREVARAAEGVIHAASTGDAGAGRADAAAVEAILQALEGSGKPFVYTSGVWVHGAGGDRVLDEESPIAPADIVAWRPAVERRVLEAAGRGVRAVVIRPAIVYGRGGGLVAWLASGAAAGGSVRQVGEGENRWPLVHVEDLADLYVRALVRAPAGTLLIAAAGPAARVSEIAERASRAAGGSGATAWPLDEARDALGPLADALALDEQASGERARRLLGWTPRGPSLWEELDRGSYARRPGGTA